VGLIDEGKIIVEVGLNESVSKDRNPNIPYGIDEVIADGIACAQAGATMLHFHARADDGTQRWNAADVYRAEMEGIGAEADVIMYPSYNGDFSHIWQLVDTPPVSAPLFMIPFDVFQGVGPVTWDADKREFSEISFDVDAIGTPKGARPAELDEIVARNMVPTICVQDLGDIRWTGHAIEAGMIHSPVQVKMFVIDRFVKGAEPTPIGIDALLAHATSDMETMIVPALMTTATRTETLLRHAMRNGAHIRVGIGDNPEAFPSQTNPELVEWVVRLAEEEGLKPATAADVRRFFTPASRKADSSTP